MRQRFLISLGITVAVLGVLSLLGWQQLHHGHDLDPDAWREHGDI